MVTEFSRAFQLSDLYSQSLDFTDAENGNYDGLFSPKQIGFIHSVNLTECRAAFPGLQRRIYCGMSFKIT
jgi:hypothetical protein